jgi:UDP-2,4-diacetamido-2,4,6-trideoxy-beta-L-altropyranose hydrolase
VFVCRTHDGDITDVIERNGYTVIRLPASDQTERDRKPCRVTTLGARWDVDARETGAAISGLGARSIVLIVDHYAIDFRWERSLRLLVDRIMVIDDLGDRSHDCDILLDQNLHPDSDALYRSRLAPGATRFFGPKYAILRPEFDEPGLLRARDGTVRNILVFFGGVDVGNQAERVLSALDLLGESAPDATIVLGATNPNREAVAARAHAMPRVTTCVTTENMARLISAADLGVGTCGISAWERCALGLPALVSISADNQRDDAQLLHKLGACWNLGDEPDVSVKEWRDAIASLRSDAARVAGMAIEASRVVEGRTKAHAALIKAIVG